MAEIGNSYNPRRDLLHGAIFYADDFLTHSVDPRFLNKVVQAFGSDQLNQGIEVDAVLTPALSGVAVGFRFSQMLDVPCIVARKEVGIANRGPLIRASVASYTGEKEIELLVSERQFAGVGSVLLVDDFISTGSALLGLLQICSQAGVEAELAAVVFAKPALGGRQKLASLGTRLWTYRELEIAQ